MYAYHSVLQIMPIFRILVVRNVSLVGRFEGFRPDNQLNDNSVETSNFAFYEFQFLTVHFSIHIVF